MSGQGTGYRKAGGSDRSGHIQADAPRGGRGPEGVIKPKTKKKKIINECGRADYSLGFVLD